MAQFSYEQYQQIAAQNQSNGDGTKIGYFKLKDDGDIAIARINISSTEEFSFAAVHSLNTNGRWMKVSCLNPLGTGEPCSLCQASQANPKGPIGGSRMKLFIPMLVSYRDPNSATGYTAPAPVVWERPATFSRDLANKLTVAGNLRNVLVLITRNGKAGDMQTTYSVDVLPAEHPVFKPEMIPEDFSAFTNFKLSKHSYWEKTGAEIQAFLTTGKFPENSQDATAPVVPSGYTASASNTFAAPPANYAMPTSAPAAPVMPPVAPTETNFASNNIVPEAVPGAPTINNNSANIPAANNAGATRNFSGFSF